MRKILSQVEIKRTYLILPVGMSSRLAKKRNFSLKTTDLHSRSKRVLKPQTHTKICLTSKYPPILNLPSRLMICRHKMPMIQQPSTYIPWFKIKYKIDRLVSKMFRGRGVTIEWCTDQYWRKQDQPMAPSPSHILHETKLSARAKSSRTKPLKTRTASCFIPEVAVRLSGSKQPNHAP